jgi:hypothetical protein
VCITKAPTTAAEVIMPIEGSAAGTILDMSVAGRGVRKQASNEIAIYTNSASGTSFKAHVYVTTKSTNFETTRRTKTLRASSQSVLLPSDNLNGTVPVIGYEDVKINTANAIAWYTTANVINKIPGEKQSLFTSDVVAIRKIYDSQSLSAIPTTSSLDITDRYTLDSGQNDDYYNHSSIILKPGSQPPTGQTAVLFEYYEHSPQKGYSSSTSYSSTIYEEQKIPVFKNKSGKVYNLRDCIDMRPLRLSGTTALSRKVINLTTRVDVTAGSNVVAANTTQLGATLSVLTPPIQTGSVIRVGTQERKVIGITNNKTFTVYPEFTTSLANTTISLVVDNVEFNQSLLNRPTDPIQLDYDFYLPRVDKLVVTKDKDFKVISGIPDLDPEEPFVDADMMEIYKLSIPAYTASLDGINTQFVDNRRYTMRDIADLDKRLQYIERVVALKEKEKETIKNPPKAGNVDKPIYGMIVDDFNDLTVVDQNNDFAASIELGKLSCYKLVTPLKLKATDPDSSNVKDKFVSLPYTEVEMASQSIATANGNTAVQTAVIAKGEGFVTLSPESDFFYNVNFAPLITDISGRAYEVNQTTPDNVVLGITGSGKYPRRYNEDLTIIGDYEYIFRKNRINIPNPSSDPTISEPSSTVPIDLSHSGVLFNKQDEMWTGQQVNRRGADPKSFEANWNDSGYITSGTEYDAQSPGKGK